jgi:hypothetical protein
MNQEISPELANYFGGFIADEVDEEEGMMVDSEKKELTKIYDHHLKLEEMIIGVREGRYFQGRLNVSRLVSSEASVKVQGLAQDILI